MDKQLLAKTLGALPFAAALPQTVVAGLAERAVWTEYPAGTLIFREGSRWENLLILSAGRVALDMFVAGRGTIRVLSLGPGDMVAWSAVLREGQMTASATALEDVRAVSLAAPDVLQACEADPVFGYHLMRQLAISLSDRLVATRLQLLDVFSDTAFEHAAR